MYYDVITHKELYYINYIMLFCCCLPYLDEGDEIIDIDNNNSSFFDIFLNYLKDLF